MRDYSNLTPDEKVRTGNRWLIRNEVEEIVISLKPEGFGIDNKDTGECLLTMPEFEEIVRQIQIEYRLDNSPENN